jgi:tRNA threonylcarbamoyl adenosine modification protein YjeE
MMADTHADAVWHRELPDEAATAALALEVAGFLDAGDLLTLSGDLGAGKTAFARALIRVLTGEPDLEVPSPTFTLMQIYDGPNYPIVHADLYRIKDPSELAGLGWDEAADSALVLVEWPERAGTYLGADRIDVAFSLDPARGETFRAATLTGFGRFAGRLAQSKAVQTVLAEAGFLDAERRFMLGDASTRAYERLTAPDGRRAILMISPPRPDGPPVRFGKPYSAIARLAEDITPFLAVDAGLRDLGLSAPEIYASDRRRGLAVLEDLGAEGIVTMGGIIPDRYAEAAAVLAALHGSDLVDTLAVGEGSAYRIPPYDAEALGIEVELLLEWYAPHVAGVTLASGTKVNFGRLWQDALAEVIAAPQTWTLRDYHSPNLIWLGDRAGIARVGLIDFQDCVLGHPAYDVVSLFQDARIDVPDDAELKLLGHYARLRREQDESFDMPAFVRAYAILGAQRATKILGIFARLDKRDRKPQYLSHLPRVEAYLRKNLAHPSMATLKAWYAANLPSLFPPES